MQDIHSVERLYGGVGGGGDRRLRPNHHQQGNGPHALKCPRCESLNTKFCYYNNYNLSQPRHFCKSCRRYWTKGGVLRNVPVGGGCRKTKRSKPKAHGVRKSSNPSSSVTELKSSNSQNSSSDSSSLTATTTAVNTRAAAVPVTAAEKLSGTNTNDMKFGSTLLNFQGCSRSFFNLPNSSIPNPSFDPTLLDQSNQSPAGNNLFPEIGTFTSLISSSTSQLPLGCNRFNLSGDISPFRLHHAVENTNANQQWIGDELKIPETGSLGFTNEFSGLPEKTTDVGLGTDDWNNGTEEALFDLTGGVDQSYWSHTQWDDDDHNNNNNHDHQLNYLP